MFFRAVYIRLFEPYCPNRFELQYDRKFMTILKMALRRALKRRHELRPMKKADFYRLERGKVKFFVLWLVFTLRSR
jgi:hypothetical protein